MYVSELIDVPKRDPHRPPFSIAGKELAIMYQFKPSNPDGPTSPAMTALPDVSIAPSSPQARRHLTFGKALMRFKGCHEQSQRVNRLAQIMTGRCQKTVLGHHSNFGFVALLAEVGEQLGVLQPKRHLVGHRTVVA